jgi:alpha-galactosidase
MVFSFSILFLFSAVFALDNGKARSPPMGYNSWMAVGWGISDLIVHEVAGYLQSSGLQAKGYVMIGCDIGIYSHRAFILGVSAVI